jgi:4-hydroxy-2-oxoheptanedioate aldolase
LAATQSPHFAARLRAGDRLVGTAVTVPSVQLAELVAEQLDFVWIDLEHGALGPADVLPLCVAARAGDCAALVRLPGAEALGLGALLDAGVDGVVAPRVESADQARRLVERLRHPPRGSRGHAARRASGYGAAAPADRPAGVPPAAPPDPLCWIQIESAAGLDAAEQIAAVDGVAALVVGCADLALALEGTLDASSSRMREAVARVQEAAESAGIASGVAGPGDSGLLHELAAGRSTVLLHSADVRIYARAVRAVASGLRTPAREVADVRA